MDAMTDQDLLKRAGRGDEAAFFRLYERHRHAVFRFAYRMLGSRELAEDVTQDCFLSLMRRPGGFDPAQASLRTYLYAAVRNLVLKQRRRMGQSVTIEDLGDEPRLPDAQGPLRRLLDEELALEVQRAIASLQLLQREVLVLFEYEGLSLAEIAAVVAADVGAVKARLHRARARVRKALGPYFKNHAGTALVKE